MARHRFGRAPQLRLDRLPSRDCPSAASFVNVTLEHLPQRNVIVRGQMYDENPGSVIVRYSGVGGTGTASTDAQGNFTAPMHCDSLGKITLQALDNENLLSDPKTVGVINLKPAIDLYATRIADLTWQVSGFLYDEAPDGMIVRFSSQTYPAMNGRTARATSDGHFLTYLELPTYQSGWILANTTDWWDRPADEVLTMVI